MRISLIGMSGVGKSYWAKQLEQAGFQRFCCDDLIEKKLQHLLKNSGTAGISEWMGQPYDTKYIRASKLYLHLEEQVVREILETIKKIPQEENVVIDTTGSVIYLNQELLEVLQKTTTIIYFRTSEETKEELFVTYCQNPKPVIWGNLYTPKQGETGKESLVRCFPELLNWRAKQYEKLAHATIDYYTLKNMHDARGLINSFQYI